MIIKPPKPGLGFGILGFWIFGFGLAWLGCGKIFVVAGLSQSHSESEAPLKVSEVLFSCSPDSGGKEGWVEF